MLVSGIKSRPVYPEALTLDPTGTSHFVVAHGDAAGRVVASALAGAGHACVSLLIDHRVELAARVETYATLADGIARLTALLDDSRMGLRLYAVGPEQFLWRVAIAADAFGFGKDEVVKVVAGSLARTVFCTHCKAVSEDVVESVRRCHGCGRLLQVRDHFSRRRGAFMGVAADAETPGVPVASEILFP